MCFIKKQRVFYKIFRFRGSFTAYTTPEVPKIITPPTANIYSSLYIVKILISLENFQIKAAEIRFYYVHVMSGDLFLKESAILLLNLA
jgi:hypothetical protein